MSNRGIIIYAPPADEPDGEAPEPESWEWDRASWTIAEIELIEDKSGLLAEEFFKLAADGWAKHQRLLLWMVRRRDEPDLRLGDLDDVLFPFLVIGTIAPAGEVADQGKALTEDPPTRGGESETSSTTT